jgi:hypothetical protein
VDFFPPDSAIQRINIDHGRKEFLPVCQRMIQYTDDRGFAKGQRALKEELLLNNSELQMMWILRKALSSLGTADTTDLLIERLTKTETNEEFADLIINTAFTENSRF